MGADVGIDVGLLVVVAVVVVVETFLSSSSTNEFSVDVVAVVEEEGLHDVVVVSCSGLLIVAVGVAELIKQLKLTWALK